VGKATFHNRLAVIDATQKQGIPLMIWEQYVQIQSQDHPAREQSLRPCNGYILTIIVTYGTLAPTIFSSREVEGPARRYLGNR
jgi:hypothetical protein